MVFPDPVIGLAIEPKTQADTDRLSIGLSKLSEEDPTFRVNTDEETGQTIISGMGELHLEIIIDRLKREFKVEVNQGAPHVAYREAITGSTEHERLTKNNRVVAVSLLTSMLKSQHKLTKKRLVLNSSIALKVVTLHVNLSLQLKKASKTP